MTPEDLVSLAIDVAEQGLEAGELPIGAVVALGDEIVGRSFAMERSQRRRLVHADLLAMEQADQELSQRNRASPRGAASPGLRSGVGDEGRRRLEAPRGLSGKQSAASPGLRSGVGDEGRRRLEAPRGLSGKQSLRLAVSLEPCLMCLGAAMALVVDEIYFGLEAPSDGAAGLPAAWQPAAPDADFCRIPPLTGGIHRARCLDQFRRYVRTAPDSGYRTWAQGLASLPD
jgi:tRNA(adenine34) deaminase